MDARTNPNTISLALVSRGDIVILDTTSYRENMMQKYGKSILLMFPEEKTERQIEIIQELLPLFENADEYTIWYDFIKENGTTKCQCLTGNSESIITDYIEEYNHKKK